MRKVNDVCYFVRGGHFGKCVITKIITVTDNENTTINFEIRPFGLDKPIQLHKDDLYNSFAIARNYLLEELKKAYEKQVNVVKNDKENKFDTWEKDYQEEQKTQDNLDKQNEKINV